ncbi:MAG: arsenate reductase ArsC [Armatimonadota bacterium]|nr:arsenate reductase ArsC [Armatimonadota bacterium]MDR7500385.1 arsenate reductase ArsC [Armatimonadota bacterium]MDR7548051.1 arsenate reductase ArsC [Armatimonadota bacterium]
MTPSPETPSPSGPRRRVLFLCTGNSARSQIAESLVNHFLGDRWEACSAGTAPAGYVHPLAIQVLREWGVGVASLRSKSVAEVETSAFDLVVTLCDEAREQCPLWPGSGQVRHLSFPDPARAAGTEQERLDAFRQVRNAIWRALKEQLAPAPSGRGGGP